MTISNITSLILSNFPLKGNNREFLGFADGIMPGHSSPSAKYRRGSIGAADTRKESEEIGSK